MFDLAPVSLWLEDYGALRLLFERWRGLGITDLRRHLTEDRTRIEECSAVLRVIKVNQRTLSLFDARDLAHLVDNLGLVFRDDMLDSHLEELIRLWDGNTDFFSNTVNYTLAGRRLDIQLSGSILPGYEASWSRVLIAIEDVTDREVARAKLAASEAYARGLFEHSPVSLWAEDFRGVKRLLDEARRQGIQDFPVFTDVHPVFVQQCLSEVHVLDVNRRTLDLFAAPDKATLLRRLDDVFRANMLDHFREQLIDLWNGKLFQQREVVNYTLDGSELHLLMQFSVLPGHEADWGLVQVALTDITARKRAEAYLEFLGKHDVLTKLYNRSFYNDEINRIERKNIYPVTVMIADLNGLKAANDSLGHAAGDSLLSRMGEVLQKAVDRQSYAARIGGDEFAILMPGADERDGAAMIDTINQMIDINNQFHSESILSFSMGVATSRPGERLEALVKRADEEMYKAKRAFQALESE
ncbi:sensor domain-containing diguanylate cyclase [Lichenihabitans sp. PAMC28606]|uniref:sensor domain-containing diguanylate cyclase n=1 Tax=Lichenihabitans sp. PAMC28606 TaxID=2880932 RepID=UPI001D0AFF2F|nr:GGDEF domain-containing protein [Lichenihabitans sp. PAMC28606]UDL94226.1 sensor domain-containing diguanylate cyclase [Lichenihabitans sp. PAMC28606]